MTDTSRRTDPDAVLARVRKLLAQAEDAAATPAEAEAFMAKAGELIARYGIDRAMLAEADSTTDQVADRVVVLDPPYAVDKADLLFRIAAPLRCRSVRRGGRGHLSTHLFGMASDLDRVELLFTSLLVQAARGMASAEIPPWEHKAAYRRTWLAGFAAAVGERLRVSEARAAATHAPAPSGRSVAVVLADRSAAVDRRLNEHYPRLGTVGRRTLSGRGIRDGYVAGQRADLGDRRVGESQRRGVE